MIISIEIVLSFEKYYYWKHFQYLYYHSMTICNFILLCELIRY